jgi:hypothetical protein
MRKLLLVMAILFITVSAIAQNRTVSGKVTDDKGAGVPGVTVMVKGTTNGTTTDAQGNYKLTVPASAKTLVFSSASFGTKEQTLGSSNSVNISLSNKEDALSEVVVTSFGIKRDKKT